MKLRFLAVITAAMVLSGATLAQTAAPVPAAVPAPDKNTLSYAIGYDLGRDFAERNVDVDVNTVIKALQDGYAKKAPAVPIEQLRTAIEQMQQKMAADAKAAFDKASAANKSKSDAFLAANKAKPGVKVLPSGVQYRVLEPGNGAKPTATSEVQVHFRGSVSTGQEFASTYTGATPQPASFKVGTFPMAGINEVLPLMGAGSHWEVVLPADKAYGNDPRSPIGPNQVVVMDMKLVSVK